MCRCSNRVRPSCDCDSSLPLSERNNFYKAGNIIRTVNVTVVFQCVWRGEKRHSDYFNISQAGHISQWPAWTMLPPNATNRTLLTFGRIRKIPSLFIHCYLYSDCIRLCSFSFHAQSHTLYTQGQAKSSLCWQYIPFERHRFSVLSYRNL